MTLKQFETEYPDYTGFIFLNGGFFLDHKLKEYLIQLELKFLEFKLDYMDNTFLRVVMPNIGPNLLYFKNGQYINNIDSLGTIDKLKDFIESCKQVG